MTRPISSGLLTRIREHERWVKTFLRGTYLVKAHLAHAILTGAQVEGATFTGATGIETVEVGWIDIGSEKVPQRLEGEQAMSWLLAAAAGRDKWRTSA